VKAKWVYLNGELIAADEAAVGVGDRGLLCGDGLYETIRVRGSRPQRMESHLTRLMQGLDVLRMPAETRVHDYAGAIGQLVIANEMPDARVRITITRGNGEKPTILITSDTLTPPDPGPVRVIVSTYRRDETNPLTRIKTINCLPSIMAAAEALDHGADDAVMLNTRGNVAEATSANVFIIEGSRLVTPPVDEGCLPGTVRETILRLAASVGLEGTEDTVPAKRMREANAVMLTSAIKLVRLVNEIDGTAIPEPPTNLALELIAALDAQ